MSPAGRGGRLVVVGSLNVDLTVRTERFPEPGETLTGSELRRAPGGKSSNQAVAAAVLGATVRMVGAVGDDDNGAFLLREAEQVGVDVGGVSRLAEHATGSAMIVVDASGENTIIISPGANGALTKDAAEPPVLEDAAVVCLCLEIPVPMVLAVARGARGAGTQVVLNLSPYAEVPGELLELTDVLLVNRSEANLLLNDAVDPSGETDWTAVLDRLAERGIQQAVITCGSDGSVVLDADAEASDDRVTLITATAVEVVDTTGCGDAFTGAVAYRLASGSGLVEAARFASEVGALAATADGAQSSYSAFAHLGHNAG